MNLINAYTEPIILLNDNGLYFLYLHHFQNILNATAIARYYAAKKGAKCI